MQAHIFVCFLALAMYKSLEMDIVMPVKDRSPVRLRVVAKPDEHFRVLLQRLGIKIPNRPKTIANVVKTLASEIP